MNERAKQRVTNGVRRLQALAVARLQKRIELIVALPMATVLDKLPSETVAGRARLLGITRQAYYDWLNEKTRPNHIQAAKLSELTGYSVQQIRGRPELPSESESIVWPI